MLVLSSMTVTAAPQDVGSVMNVLSSVRSSEVIAWPSVVLSEAIVESRPPSGRTFTAASFLVDLPVEHVLVLLPGLFLVGFFFAQIGVLVGVRAEQFDDVSTAQTFILQPLIFLGGVFYSASLLPEPFETLTRFDLPVVFVIGNDAAWGEIRIPQVGLYGAEGEVATRLAPTPYERLTEVFGGHGERVERPDELAPALERALAAGEPAIVNVMLDPDAMAGHPYRGM